jgi:deoxyribose-phosphate aldolase
MGIEQAPQAVPGRLWPSGVAAASAAASGAAASSIAVPGTAAAGIATSDAALRQVLHGLPGVDQVGAEARAASLATRSG